LTSLHSFGKEINPKNIAEFYYIIIDQNSKGYCEILKKYIEFVNKTINIKQNKNQNNNNNNNINDINENNNIFIKSFGSNIIENKLEEISNNYIYSYYEAEESKTKRQYKMENAGVNWSKDDIEKFYEGLRRFGHTQLANTRIAKFMGAHIEVSHVKLFRSKITMKRRIKRKMEKESKIKEMKKKKNLRWKLMSTENNLDENDINN
jgi:hypothetical protein